MTEYATTSGRPFTGNPTLPDNISATMGAGALLGLLTGGGVGAFSGAIGSLLTEGFNAAFGFRGMAYDIPALLSRVVGGPVGAIISPFVGMLGDAVGDLFNMRSDESLRDKLEGAYGYKGGRLGFAESFYDKVGTHEDPFGVDLAIANFAAIGDDFATIESLMETAAENFSENTLSGISNLEKSFEGFSLNASGMFGRMKNTVDSWENIMGGSDGANNDNDAFGDYGGYGGYGDSVGVEHSGNWNIPRTGRYELMKGEMVLPRDAAELMRNSGQVSNGGQGGGRPINIVLQIGKDEWAANVNAITNKQTVKLARRPVGSRRIAF